MQKVRIYIVAVIFLLSSVNVAQVHAGEIVVPIIPQPGTMVHLSPAFTPAHLKGIVIDPQNALQFDFLIEQGDGQLNADDKNQEYTKLVKYFLAALTVPDQDQWVNLSPYEKDRIVPESFGKTEMGRDLLAQDYLLKQITSSLMYPETGIGKTFWDRVYARAQEQFGSLAIPMNAFNKVWITPDKAVVYQSGNTAYIQYSHLKVMLEEDYLAVSKNKILTSSPSMTARSQNVSSQIIQEIIIPELEREVNEGKNFAQLRQVFSGMILATWYKKSLKESILGQVYVNKTKIKGVELNQMPKDLKAGLKEETIGPEKLYQHYLQALKKGAYNYIKEIELPDGNLVPRKYFAGGVVNNISHIAEFRNITSQAMMAAIKHKSSLDAAQVGLSSYAVNRAISIESIDHANQAMITDLNFDETIAYYAMNNDDVAMILRELFKIATRDLIADDGDLTLFRFEFEETYAHYESTIRDIKQFGVEMPLLTKDMIHSKIMAIYEDSLHYVDLAMTAKEVKGYVESIADHFGAFEIEVGQNIISQSYIEEKLRSDFAKKMRHLVFPSKIKEHIRFVNVGNSKEIMKWVVNVPFSIEVILKAHAGYIVDEGNRSSQELLEANPFSSHSNSTGFLKLMDKIDERKNRVAAIIERIRKINDELYETRRLLGVANERFLVLLMKPINESEKIELNLEVVRLENNTISLKEEKMGLQAEFKKLGAERRGGDRAMNAQQGEKDFTRGGIDMNADNLDLDVKYDGNGMLLPILEKNLSAATIAQLSQMEGLVPRIIEIRPASSLPINKM